MAHILRQIGGLGFILGVLAIVLNFMNMVPSLLVWIYMWGEGVAWIIKLAFVLVGAILWFVGYNMENKETEPTNVNPESLSNS